MKAEIKTEVGKMLEAGIIEKSNSAYASPVVLVKKKDGNYRFCVDYRKINGITKFHAQPIGNPDAMFQKMQKGRYFSKMDLAKGYWQIPMSEDSQQYTAFITEFGLFQFKRMPFGLVNSGATFTKLMRHVLEGLPTTDSFVDDIITHSKEFEGHLRDVREVLERLRDAKLTIKPSKCMLGYTHVEFLGQELGEGCRRRQHTGPDKSTASRGNRELSELRACQKCHCNLERKTSGGENIEVVSAEQYFRDKTHRNGHCTGANTAWRMWEHSTTSRGGEGGKGGSGFFSFFRGQDGQPVEPGPNGRGGEGGKGGAGFFGGLFGGGGHGGKGGDQTRGGINTEQSDNGAGNGGKGGAGMFGLFKGQDGQPGELGPNGRGGEGGKGGGSR
ncbi:uncharacterized protein LOC127849097 [Dreissena polymorpha]|nr:uncharacterized protein LOC127849097 [Dreissena polymorpha]